MSFEQHIYWLKSLTADEIENINLFKILKVNEESKGETIEQNFRKLFSFFHPDNQQKLEKHGFISPFPIELLRQKIEESHHILGNEEEKNNYIYMLERQKQGLSINPKDFIEAERLYRKGKALLDNGVYNQALDYLEQAKNLTPEEVTYKGAYLFAKFMKFNDNATIEKLQSLVTNHPQHLDLNIFLGKGFFYQQELLKAKNQFGQAARLNPHHLEIEKYQRLIQLQLKQPKKEVKSGLWQQMKDSLFKKR